MSILDPRLHAFRADLADIRLKGSIEAARFAEGALRQVSAPVAAAHREPRADAMQTTQALMGERCRVFESREGWAWAQLETDGYVGYIAEANLSGSIVEPTHRVAVLSTFLFPAANIKSQPATSVPMNAKVTVIGGDGRFAKLASGDFIIAAHLKPVAEHESDFIAIAARFLHVPYLWGGKSAAGVDCSGLLQVALEASGIPCPRDTDMQEKALGRAVLANDLDSLKRGDLVFWKGHAGFMADPATLLHANGHHMQTVMEPLREAVARIKNTAGEITAIKRL
jgi:cell wall-associated NlpC family hydrolase